MLIDSHAHIYLEQFEEDLEQVLENAHAAGVNQIVMPAIDLLSIEKALDLCEKYDGLYAMTALHPSETKEATDEDFRRVEAFCSHPKIVAVGESGLDYYWDRSFDEIQHRFLRLHIQLAIKADLPLILHNREAADDIIRILEEEKARSSTPDKLRGIFHCFGGPDRVVASILELGFYFGIGGTLTFKNGGVPDAIQAVPLDRMVLETDAPFLTPAPFRGKRNEPAHVRLVAEKLADVRGKTITEIAEITTRNTASLFALP